MQLPSLYCKNNHYLGNAIINRDFFASKDLHTAFFFLVLPSLAVIACCVLCSSLISCFYLLTSIRLIKLQWLIIVHIFCICKL